MSLAKKNVPFTFLTLLAIVTMFRLRHTLPANVGWLYINHATKYQDTELSKSGTHLLTSSLDQARKKQLQLLINAKLDPTNLIYNGGFEYHDQGWTILGTANVQPTLTTNRARSGNQSLQINFDGSDVNFYQTFQKIVVMPNVCYHLIAYIFTRNLTDGVALEVWDAERGFEYWYGGHTPLTLGSSATWTPAELQFCTPEDVKSIQLRLRRYNGSAVSGTAWFDDIRLQLVHRPISTDG